MTSHNPPLWLMHMPFLMSAVVAMVWMISGAKIGRGEAAPRNRDEAPLRGGGMRARLRLADRGFAAKA
jgi:hypothetical protein